MFCRLPSLRRSPEADPSVSEGEDLHEETEPESIGRREAPGRARLAPERRTAASGPQAPDPEERTPHEGGPCGPETYLGDKRSDDQ